jgi:predicted nucleic acid-binding protein
MGLKRVLDTNAILYFLGGRLAEPPAHAIIAATALTTGAELLTNDEKLARIPGLTCRSLKLKLS